ncbi:MAG TPA: TolC family protein, partial [Sphingobacteriaceae bacterium]
MKTIIKNLLMLPLGFAAGDLSAQTAPSPAVELTLKDALNYALKNNQNVRKAQLDIQGGRYKTDEVRAGALPQVNGSASLTDQMIKPQFVLPGDALGRPGELVTLESGTTYS